MHFLYWFKSCLVYKYKMQIIVSPISGGENFLLDIDSGSDVKELRLLVAQKLASVPEGVKVCRPRALSYS